MIEYRFRVPSATVFTLYSYSKALEYRLEYATADSLIRWPRLKALFVLVQVVNVQFRDQHTDNVQKKKTVHSSCTDILGTHAVHQCSSHSIYYSLRSKL
jgi:hypothetical protein